MQRGSMVVLYGVSFALHASLGLGMREIEPEKEPDRIAISVVNVPKPKPKQSEPPPPPPPPPPPVNAPKKAARPKAMEAPPPAPAAVQAPTFGIAMTGGVGAGGIALPAGDSLHPPQEPVRRVAQAKTLAQPTASLACAEPATKPKPLQMPRPEYTEQARAANIEGRVRVELTVDASGAVTQVKVLESLGHGLDEAALRAVQAASFEPALQCGKPVSATFVVSIRFSL